MSNSIGKNRRQGRLWRMGRVLLATTLLGLWVVVDSDVASAVDTEEFQLESATIANPSTKPGAPATILQGQADTDDDAADTRDFDWESFFDGSGPTLDGVANTIAINPVLPDGSRANFVISGAAADFMTPDLTGYATGSKDDLPIQGDPTKVGDGWQCKEPNNLGPKFDLLNATAVAYRNPTNQHLMVYFASEISSPNGDRNAGFWFLKDSSANCVSTGTNTDWTGQHTTGDVLVVAAFSGGGETATVSAFKWVDPTPGNGTDADGFLEPQGTGGTGVVGNECGASPHRDACAVTNEANEVDTPWASPDADGGNLNPNEFVEGGIDLTAVTGEQCFATAVANSRSSTTPGSTVHDFARFSFATCGDLKIVKYVDLDGDGVKDGGEPAGRWAFKVFTTGANPATATPVCQGTTNSSGELTCTGLTPGSYDVYETQVSGFYNTQAGTTVAVNTGATPSFTVNMPPAGATVTFGNICYVDKTFRINNVPTAAPASITVEYSVNDGAYSTLELAATSDSTIWEGAVNNTLLQTDSIDWRWYINGDTANKVTGGTDESLQAANPTSPSANPPTDTGCQKVNSDSFDLTPLDGKKFKDMNGDGAIVGDPGLAGFEVKLYRRLSTGPDVFDTTAAATGVSVCNDDPLTTEVFECTEAPFAFTPASVAPGVYKVVETQQTGWRQTLPAAVAGVPGTRLITITLGQVSASAGNWANTPLSSFSMTFTPDALYPAGNGPKSGTAPTTGTITCTNDPGSQTGNTYTATNQQTGTYSCQLVILDP